MEPEIWVGVAAVFVSGGAIGATGTLLAQWVLGKLRHPEELSAPPHPAELNAIREDVADLAMQIHNIDARLDFQEQLLGGGTPTSVPPPRLPQPKEGEG